MVFTTQTNSLNSFRTSKQFVLKRIVRIVPLFYFVLVLWLVLIRNSFSAHSHGLALIKTMLFLPLFNDFNGIGVAWSSLGPFYGAAFMYVNWSLNYEMLFYFIFACSFFFRVNRYYFISFIFVLCLVVIPLILNNELSFDIKQYHSYTFEYFNLLSNPILWYFLSGVLIGLTIEKLKIVLHGKRITYMVFYSALCIFILYIVKFLPTTFFFQITSCSLLAIGALLMDLNKGSINNPFKFIIVIGNMSYSVYLVHAIVFMYLPLLYSKFGILNLISEWYSVLFIYGIVLAFSYCTYYFIEKKFTDMLRRKLL